MNTNENIISGTAGSHPARRRGPGWRPRSRFLAGAAATAIAAGAVLGPVLAAGPASAASRVSWLMGAGNVHGLSVEDPAIATYFFNTPTAFGAGSSLVGNPIQPGYTTTPVLSYTSYAQFASDIQNGLMTFPYHWVMYDPEKWAQTPVAEQQNPVKYMTLFGQLAHAHGLKVIQAPAMDLAYVLGSVTPRLLGETSAAWYVRAGLAGAAAASGDILNLQEESQATNLASFDSLFSNAAAQAHAVNPNVKVFAEVSTYNATPAQMAAAAESISPDGYYVAAPGATSQLDQFFQYVKAAGY
jgi:hypothetical protein